MYACMYTPLLNSNFTHACMHQTTDSMFTLKLVSSQHEIVRLNLFMYVAKSPFEDVVIMYKYIQINA